MIVDDQDRGPTDDRNASGPAGGAHSAGRVPPDETFRPDAEPRHRRPVEADPDTIAGAELPEDR
jgi:hypothetical protein